MYKNNMRESAIRESNMFESSMSESDMCKSDIYQIFMIQGVMPDIDVRVSCVRVLLVRLI